ncbi:MAG TPA: hybrid sensor histidine kinase/response regulator [Gemmataceae bacterium]|nr:hybrid sensor histidine kinase/response regulator [Gemmataceae bacterium]
MVQRHTLLIVDDEPDVVQSLRDLLRREYNVLGATHAREAMRLLHEQPVHVVMSDQRMPDISGVEFLRMVRRDCPDAIRLLFTGYADIKAVIGAINEGHVYRYITKPWDPEELRTVLHQAAEQYDLLQERQRLLDDLRSKNRELEQANAELRQANALKEAFINVASHELRTPLTILLSLPELALRMKDLHPVTADCFQRIQQAGSRLHRLVEQMLLMLRAGRFERPLDCRPTSCASLVREAVEDVRPFVEQRQQRLTVDLADDLGTIDVEAGKIRICFDNLLSNAIKFTPDKGPIEVRGRRDGDVVCLQIRDSGVGIAAADLPHIFEPFFTEVDVSRHSSGQFEFGRRGMGLGLSLVRAFVHLHGGTVQVDSTLGQGTTFTITLPGDAVSQTRSDSVGYPSPR